MALTTPEWLARHGGDLRPGTAPNSWAVLLGGEQQYALALVPIQGKHGCRVVQTINGKRLDSGGTHATADLALQRRCGFRVVGRRERIARHHGVWRDTLLTERRSPTVGRE